MKISTVLALSKQMSVSRMILSTEVCHADWLLFLLLSSRLMCHGIYVIRSAHLNVELSESVKTCCTTQSSDVSTIHVHC